MLKKRLIFTLLSQKGVFQLSRNFSLQAVGTFDWLMKHYEWSAISRSIDELILLNVSRGEKHMQIFRESVSQLSAHSFMPIAAGGGIETVDDAYRLLDAGAEKLVVNNTLFSTPKTVEELAKIFGTQCVIASLDYRKTKVGNECFCQAATKSVGMKLESAIQYVENLGAGELYLTSINRDGTGQGYDLETLEAVSSMCRLPIIASGGVGDFVHLLQGLQLRNVTGVSTANIFNFMNDGLTQARKFIEKNGIELAHWDFSSLPLSTSALWARQT